MRATFISALAIAAFIAAAPAAAQPALPPMAPGLQCRAAHRALRHLLREEKQEKPVLRRTSTIKFSILRPICESSVRPLPRPPAAAAAT